MRVVNLAFTIAAQQFRNGYPLDEPYNDTPGGILRHDIHITGQGAFAEAADLMAKFGDHAVSEARRRAGRSRELGNVIHFCRWREVERMIGTLEREDSEGLVH